jgi:recombination protein RecA
VKKSGSFYSYGEQRIGQGRENTREYLKAHPDLTDQLEAELRALLAGSAAPSANGTAEPSKGEAAVLAGDA